MFSVVIQFVFSLLYLSLNSLKTILSIFYFLNREKGNAYLTYIGPTNFFKIMIVNKINDHVFVLLLYKKWN